MSLRLFSCDSRGKCKIKVDSKFNGHIITFFDDDSVGLVVGVA